MELHLSRLLLDPTEKIVQRAMNDVYRMHELVLSGFEGREPAGRVLYRVEPEHINNAVLILMQSAEEPCWQTPPPGFLGLQSRRITPAFPRGVCMPFRLRANTVVCRDGKRRGLVRDDALRDWLLRRARDIGAEFPGFDVADEGYTYGWKPGRKRHEHHLAFKSTRFDGHLRVTDPERFSHALACGVGPAKGFGHGLISVRYPG